MLPIFATHPRRTIGFVADWCPLTDAITAFEIAERRSRLWLIFVPLDRGRLISHEIRSVKDPRIVYPAAPDQYTSILTSLQPLETLTQLTNPQIREIAEDETSHLEAALGTDAPTELRVEVIVTKYRSCEYWCHFNRLLGPRRLIVPVFAGLFLIAGLFAGATALHAPNFVTDVVALLLVGWTVWLLREALQITRHGWRAVRRPLARSLAELDPTRHELKEAWLQAKRDAPQVARHARPSRVLRQIRRERGRRVSPPSTGS